MATRANLTAWLIVLIAAGFIEVDTAAAATYTVGEELGWTVLSNMSYYQSWAASKSFMLSIGRGRTMWPKYRRPYDNCTQVISALGSPVDIQLLKGGSYHYICTVNSNCELGQKLSITFGSSAPTPPTSPSNSASSTALASSILVPTFLTVTCLNLLCHYTRH
ncbi:hypothetical protein BT93_C0748 [Corymbia citriodora subsp. variegata]|nr:hypothetical protein BT93_C0748 [Corymbia citriodora subsp. variegata]